ncbi:MAG: hypothetical protein VB997_05250, partial [Opitutales bacterium]
MTKANLFLVLLFGFSWAQLEFACGVEAYHPFNSQAKGQVPPSPRESLSRITVPAGFHIELFAAEPSVRQPISMTFDTRGRLWVAESYT